MTEMNSAAVTGQIHSIQTLGTLDGPGVRFVLFLQGCNLRCGCCHNPDTWSLHGGSAVTAEEIADKAERYRTYFGKRGGITVSGGEPLLQAEFVTSLFRECHARGIHTCLDTSGSILGDATSALLTETDRILLDIKYPTDEQYRAYVGCSIEEPLRFLSELNERAIPTTLRQVTIPTLNDNAESVLFLKELQKRYPVIDQIELLPFRKICTTKYEKLGIDFRFCHLPEPDGDRMQELRALLSGS